MTRLILALFIICVFGCTHIEKPLIYIVTSQPDITSLYFSGTIEPLKIFNITAPFDGTITQKNFDYGESVKKNQILFEIHSSELENEFQTTLTDYLKAKKEFATNQAQLQETNVLNKNGIISKDEFLTTQNTAYYSQLAYQEAQQKLNAILVKTNIPLQKILNLNLANTLNTNISLQLLSHLYLIAPTSGVALLPSKETSSTTDNTNAELTAGDTVKAGQTLLTIGDMSGLTIIIKVNEDHINAIKNDEKAIVSGDAFPNITLNGYVAHIDQQASSTDSSSVPSFAVEIVVPKLTPQQENLIHVGMSAKVELQLANKSVIKIPLSAVITENNNNFVNVINPRTQKIKRTPVITGATTIDQVEILQGLKAGERLLIPS